MAGTRVGAAAEAAEARAGPGVTLRPFAPFSGAAEADEGGGDWSFIDCEMEEVDLQDLPSATIACHLDPRVFVDGLCRVRAVPWGRRAEGGHLLPGGGGAGRSAEVLAGPGSRRGGEATLGDAAMPPAARPRSPSVPARVGGALPYSPGFPAPAGPPAQPVQGSVRGSPLGVTASPRCPCPRVFPRAGRGRWSGR